MRAPPEKAGKWPRIVLPRWMLVCLLRHDWTPLHAFYEPNGPIRFRCTKCLKKTEIYWPALRLAEVSRLK